MTKRYKFLRTGLKSDNGNIKWKFGKWEKYEDELEMCQAGFHCSLEPYDAFSYVQGEIIAEVEVRGKSLKQDDKQVWEEMRIIRAWKWTKRDSVKLAIYSAELCLPNFEKEYPKDKRPQRWSVNEVSGEVSVVSGKLSIVVNIVVSVVSSGGIVVSVVSGKLSIVVSDEVSGVSVVSNGVNEVSGEVSIVVSEVSGD